MYTRHDVDIQAVVSPRSVGGPDDPLAPRELGRRSTRCTSRISPGGANLLVVVRAC